MLILLFACAPSDPSSVDRPTPTDGSTVTPVRDDFDNDPAWCVNEERTTHYMLGETETATLEATFTEDGRDISIRYPGDFELVRTFLPGSWRWDTWVTRGGDDELVAAWNWDGHQGEVELDETSHRSYRGTPDGRLLWSLDSSPDYTFEHTVTYVEEGSWRIASQTQTTTETDAIDERIETWTWDGDVATVTIELDEAETDTDGERIDETARSAVAVETRTYTPSGQLLSVSRPTVSYSGPGGTGTWFGTERTQTFVDGTWRYERVVSQNFDGDGEVWSESVTTYDWTPCD